MSETWDLRNRNATNPHINTSNFSVLTFTFLLFVLKVFITNLQLNPCILKLPQLLSHFLYQNKTLALPGIGVFTLDSSVAIPSPEEAEQPQILQGISYEQTHVARADTKLIDFIHKYTGKMKPLAESDLDSYLRLGIQLLNIGKPFHFDGIGSIVKNKQEKYEFIPGEYSTTRLILPGDEKAEMTDRKQKMLDEEKKEYAPNQRATKGLLLAIAIVVGITIIGVAGYHLYKKKMPAAKNTPENEVPLKEDTETVQQANAKPFI